MVIGQPFSFARGGAHHTASVTKARMTKSGSPKAGPKGRQQDFCFYTFWGKKCFPHMISSDDFMVRRHMGDDNLFWVWQHQCVCHMECQMSE